MPSDFTWKAMNAVHRAVLRASGNRIGARFKKLPLIELTTTGRRSGQRRTVMLAVPGAPRQRMRARVATGDERAVLWPGIASDWKHFRAYQDKTQREIPLVLLEPC